ncbi:MAG: hypothetical protein AB1499_10460 [Nitrospirota bacterium]
MKKKKPFSEPVLLKHKQKLDEITKWYNDLGSRGVDTGTSGRNGKHGRCPLGFK